MPVQRHNVVIPREDGGVEVHPLKEWLRQHPEILPGIDPNANTTHQLRGLLRRKGWEMQEATAEVRLIKPGADSSLSVVDEVLGSSEISDETTVEPGVTFSLEYQLRDFIASNFDTVAINGKRLKLYIDPTGRDGVEYPSAVGPIDILAVDDTGAFFVFELKRANSADRAIGQVARYMGWIKQTIGKDREVFGVIVAKSIGDNLRYAASIVPKIHLFEYEVKFFLNRALIYAPVQVDA